MILSVWGANSKLVLHGRATFLGVRNMADLSFSRFADSIPSRATMRVKDAGIERSNVSMTPFAAA